MFHLRRPPAVVAGGRVSLSSVLRAAGFIALVQGVWMYAAPSIFQPISTFPSGGIAQFSAVNDVNQDGKLDVVVSNQNGVIAVVLGNGDGTFQAPRTIAALPAGTYPIVSADVNRDGIPDVVVLKTATASVAIYQGRGDGSFAGPRTVVVGNSPTFMVTADLNGDQTPDLIFNATVANTVQWPPNGFTYLLGDGNGGFNAPVTVMSSYGTGRSVLTAGDVNNDGHQDVITCDGAGNAQVFLGDGHGAFSELSPFPDGVGPMGGESQLLLADLYGNGKLDLVVGNFGSQGYTGPLMVLEGNGDGTFGGSVSLKAGFFPTYVASADMNGDGRQDLLVANTVSSSVTVLINHGGGNFTSAADNYATAFLESNLSLDAVGLLGVGDFNNDGKPDVEVASINGLNVLMNLGSGILHAPESAEVGQLTAQIFPADLNGDGRPDLAVATLGPQGIYGGISILAGHGDGTLTVTPFAFQGDLFIGNLVGGDFNGDGKIGVAAFGYGSGGMLQSYNMGNFSSMPGPTVAMPNPPTYVCAGDFNRDGYSDYAALDGNEVNIYLNLHDGTYSGPFTYQAGAAPWFILARDLNHDGKSDLVVVNHDSNDVSVLLGKGDGTFAAGVSYPAGTNPTVVTTGDFNRDGKIDLAVGDNAKTIAVLNGNGDGTFGTAYVFPVPVPVSYLAQGDFRGNGKEDLVAVSTDFTGATIPQNVFLLLGDGAGKFDAPVSIAAGANPYWVAIADYNGDGTPDLVVSDYFSSALVLLLNQRGTRIALTASSASASAGQTVTFTASLGASVPGAGVVDGTVAFKDGSKAIGIAKLVNGKATFSTAGLGPGAHAIRASYWESASFNPHVSQAVTVTVN
jgi:Bacterial Ig-like domain (group 3)/FG-GAP-like repeat